MFKPMQVIIQVIGGYISHRPVGRQDLGKETDIGQESFDRVGGTTLVVQVKLPGIDGRDEACLDRKMGRGGFGHENLLPKKKETTITSYSLA
jgi:hypothetical protein